MMSFDHFREVFSTIGKNPLRTILTSFSIFWGIFILIILLAGGNGIQNKQLAMFKDDAVNSIWIYASKTSIPHKGLPAERKIQMTNLDYDAVKELVPEADHITSRFMLRGSNMIRYKDKSGSYEIRSVHPDHKYLEMTIMERGRFINDIDLERERKVTVISEPIAEYLFEDEDPIDKYLIVNSIPFKVVGTFTDAGGQFEENKIYLPITTAQKAFNGGEDIQRLMFTLGDLTLDESNAVKERVRHYLAATHDFSVDDPRAVYLSNNLEGYTTVQNLFKTINYFIWFIGIMSLIAGIVGVSNIMMISVKERVKEIGIRKAIGATPLSVINIILQESVLITIFSGLIGIAAGYGLVYYFNTLIPNNPDLEKILLNPSVELSVVLTALGFLVFFGAIAGLIPAVRAARIKPVEVLRED